MAHTLDGHLAFDCHCKQRAVGHAIDADVRQIGLFFMRIRFASQKRQQRQALLDLDDHLLLDVGISREGAKREAAKPFWA